MRARSGTVSHYDWRELLQKGLRHKLQVTAAGPMETIFRTGPYAGLVGHTIADLNRGVRTPEGLVKIVAGSGGAVRLDQRLGKLAPFSPFVPTYLTGDLLPKSGDARDLVVAVNGRVRATARTVQDGERPPLALMLPEASLKVGQNRIEFFVANPVGFELVHLKRAALLPRQ